MDKGTDGTAGCEHAGPILDRSATGARGHGFRGAAAGLGARLALIVAVGLAPATVLGPQPAAAQAYSFSSVKIEGNTRIEAGTILSYAAIPRGQAMTAGQLNDAYQRLVGSGLFEAVDLSPQGGTLVIKVTEYPTVNVVNVEGNKRLKDEQILGFLKSKPRHVYSPALAEEDAAAIVAAYSAAGRLAATVTPKIIRRSNNRVDLVFEVVEGKVVEIERLSFVGNRSYSDYRLRRVLGTKQAGIFRQIVQSDTFVPERVEFDKRVLRDFYQSRGYIDFRVKSVTSEFSREKNAFFLTFNVEEGQSYRFGTLTVSSEIPEADADEFRPQLKIRSGKTYNPALVDNVISRMEGLALKKGLNFVRVDPRVTRNDRDGTLDIDFVLVRGERIFVERIDIEGNATTLDRVVRTQFRTAEGDPFNPREIREASERIKALGFFGNTDVQARQGTGPDQVIVDVNVEEQPTGSFSLGGSYGADGGFGVNIAFAEANFLGRGQALEFGIVRTSSSNTVSFSFAEPNVLGRDLKFGIALGYEETNEYNSYISTRLGSFTPSLEFPLSENGRLQVRYNLGYSNLFGIDDGDADKNGKNDGDLNNDGIVDSGETWAGSSKILHDEAALGSIWRSGVGYSYFYDTRTTGLNPNGGSVLRFSQDFYGLGGDTQFIKTGVQAAVERRIANDDVTVRASFEGGALTMLGSGGTSRITDRYMLSSQQFRGFAYGGIGPRDLNVANRDALGGNYFAVARLEAEFPLGLPEEYGITGGAFVDAGSLWGLDKTAGGPLGASPVDDGFHLRASAGFSIFWETPIGPLRLNFSRPLKKQSYDKPQSFDVSVSTRF